LEPENSTLMTKEQLKEKQKYDKNQSELEERVRSMLTASKTLWADRVVVAGIIIICPWIKDISICQSSTTFHRTFEFIIMLEKS
jgi:hypothetical protein